MFVLFLRGFGDGMRKNNNILLHNSQFIIFGKTSLHYHLRFVFDFGFGCVIRVNSVRAAVLAGVLVVQDVDEELLQKVVRVIRVKSIGISGAIRVVRGSTVRSNRSCTLEFVVNLLHWTVWKGYGVS